MKMQQCEADWQWKRQKRATTRDAYGVTNQQRMAQESSWVDQNVEGPAGF